MRKSGPLRIDKRGYFLTIRSAARALLGRARPSTVLRAAHPLTTLLFLFNPLQRRAMIFPMPLNKSVIIGYSVVCLAVMASPTVLSRSKRSTAHSPPSVHFFQAVTPLESHSLHTPTS